MSPIENELSAIDRCVIQPEDGWRLSTETVYYKSYYRNIDNYLYLSVYLSKEFQYTAVALENQEFDEISLKSFPATLPLDLAITEAELSAIEYLTKTIQKISK